MELTLNRLDAIDVATKVASATIESGRETDEEREQMPFRLRSAVADALRAFCGERGLSLNRAANELLAAALGLSS